LGEDNSDLIKIHPELNCAEGDRVFANEISISVMSARMYLMSENPLYPTKVLLTWNKNHADIISVELVC